MVDPDFPRLLYKKSDAPSAEPIWDMGTFETLVVADQAECDAAIADGWMQRPDDEPAAAKAAETPKKATPQ